MQKLKIMNFYFTTTVKDTFDNVIVRVTEELKKEGFGIITEINMKETFKKKLDIDFKNYRILGACNPKFAHHALSIEEKIGIMLPCNVIVNEIAENEIEVSAINPKSSMEVVGNEKLTDVASQVSEKLQRVIANL